MIRLSIWKEYVDASGRKRFDLSYAPLPPVITAEVCQADVTGRVRFALAEKGFMKKGTKIPIDLTGYFDVDGHAIWVAPGRTFPPGSRRKSSAHRLFINVEGRAIPTGRVQQALGRKSRTAK